jgi:hypothetical protein
MVATFYRVNLEKLKVNVLVSSATLAKRLFKMSMCVKRT